MGESYCPAGNPSKRSRFNRTPDLRAQAALVVRTTDLRWSHWPLTVGDETLSFNNLESSIYTCITSYLLNFCETKIPCLLNSRLRFAHNNFYITTNFKLCASYQAICRNRKNCVILISLVNCKYDMTSCPVYFTTCLDRQREQTSRKVSFRWLQWG